MRRSRVQVSDSIRLRVNGRWLWLTDVAVTVVVGGRVADIVLDAGGPCWC